MQGSFPNGAGIPTALPGHGSPTFSLMCGSGPPAKERSRAQHLLGVKQWLVLAFEGHQVPARLRALQNPTGSAQRGMRTLLAPFPTILGFLAKIWIRAEATEPFHQLLSISTSHEDGLQPPSLHRGVSSLDLDLIINSHFNSMFSTGESCQQKLWNLTHPRDPKTHGKA